ncbi:unnamed protein product [Fraxinus pennsylvanica]|uniref:Proline-rich protein n=1 Tax=Fraxinus pennsylvanica TaxID=56036 RepID=A0AAD2DSH6_9LAMI|nr:unnamed protein product [Fraxinus pennsylvanica]
MGVLLRLSGLLLSFLLTLTFCNGKNMTVKIVGFIDCTDCIIQEFDSNRASLGLRVAISCKSTNGEMQTMGNGGVDREGNFNITLSNQISDDETTVQGCLAKLHSASGAPCPIQTAQAASMKIIRSEDNGTQAVDVTQKLKFSPGTCQSAFFWPFIRYKFFGQPNITYVPKLSPPPGPPVEYAPPPLQALPPPAPAPVSIDPSLPPTQSLPPLPPAQSPTSPIQYSTPPSAPGPIDPSIPPTQSAPPPVHQYSVPPPTPVCKDPSSPPIQSLPPTIPPAPVKGSYPTLAPPPPPTFESPISPPVSAPPLSPPPYAQAPHSAAPTNRNPFAPHVPSSKRPNAPPSPIIKTPLAPPAPKLQQPFTPPPVPKFENAPPPSKPTYQPNPPSIAPISPKPPPSPIEKSLPPSKTPLLPVPNSPPSNGHSITIPRAPPVPKLPHIPTVPRRFFNPPKSKYLPPQPSHHLH